MVGWIGLLFVPTERAARVMDQLLPQVPTHPPTNEVRGTGRASIEFGLVVNSTIINVTDQTGWRFDARLKRLLEVNDIKPSQIRIVIEGSFSDQAVIDLRNLLTDSQYAFLR